MNKPELATVNGRPELSLAPARPPSDGNSSASVARNSTRRHDRREPIPVRRGRWGLDQAQTGPGGAALTGGLIRSDERRDARAAPVTVAVITRDRLTAELLRTGLGDQSGLRVLANDQATAADVVVLVVDELDETGLAETSRFFDEKTGPKCALVIVCDRVGEYQIMPAIDRGLVAVIERSEATLNRIVDAVLNAQAGRAEMPHDVLGAVLRRMRTTRSTAPLVSQITGRERDVLRLLSEGCSTATLAARLHLSERTIKNIIMSLTSRLGAQNRAHLVGFGFRNGLL